MDQLPEAFLEASFIRICPETVGPMASCTRHHRPGLFGAVRVCLVLLAVAIASPAAAQGYLDPAHPLHARLADDIAQGRVTEADALMTALRAVFAPEDLQPAYAALTVEPLRCATSLLRAVDSSLTDLNSAQHQTIQGWRARPAARRRTEFHLSPGGRFQIEYSISGPDSVDITDIDPANGIPDFVEQLAFEFENSWTHETDLLGFDAPDTGGMPYEVQLLAIGSFGYTELDAMAPGGTRIVMRNSYEGLPANEDPDGSALGSLRVTAAHELRHAGQYATSAWSEPGLWIEIDAVWIEDQVYDDVNDYYRYLQSGSPISDPPLPLDSGGTPSYSESIFEFWIEERTGLEGVREFWERRRGFPAEHPLDSYDAVLTSHYSPLDSAFVDFALYNLQCGSLAAPGIGYTEAAGYPDTRFSEELVSLPASIGSTVEHLSAKLYRIEGFSPGDEEVLVRLRQPEGLNLEVAALVIEHDGTRIEEGLTMSGPDQSFRLASVAKDIATLFLVVANGNPATDQALFFADVEEVAPVFPPPVPTLDDTWDTLTLAVGQTRPHQVDLANEGPGNSTLHYIARAVEPPMAAARGIEYSWLSIDQLGYLPGDTTEYSFVVRNGGTALGFIAGVSITLPPGVTMVSGKDIVSEAGTSLTFVGFSGQTGAVHWLDLDGGFGPIASGQTGVGKVTLSFALQRTGPAPLDWTLDGDGFGGGQQQVTGQALLSGPADPRLEIISPDPMPVALVGEPVNIRWVSADPAPVTIELSRDDGQSWEVLADSTANDGYTFWVADAPVTDFARFRVRSGSLTSVPSTSFPILQTVPWATMLPETGTLSAGEGIGLLLRVDATGMSPGLYPVRVDVRDTLTSAYANVDLTVNVVASPVERPGNRPDPGGRGASEPLQPGHGIALRAGHGRAGAGGRPRPARTAGAHPPRHTPRRRSTYRALGWHGRDGESGGLGHLFLAPRARVRGNSRGR